MILCVRSITQAHSYPHISALFFSFNASPPIFHDRISTDYLNFRTKRGLQENRNSCSDVAIDELALHNKEIIEM